MKEMPPELEEALNYFAAMAFNERAEISRIERVKWIQRIKQFIKRKGEKK
jgi:hypothetical protein